MRNHVVAGRSGRHDRPVRVGRRASAAIPASDGVARWSADAAPSSAASSAPPDGASSSAWSRGAIPYAAAASRIRRLWSAVKTPSSQNTSQKRARPWAATPGICSSMHAPDVGLGALRTRPELGRDGVGAEERRHDLDRPLAAELVGDLEEAQLGRQVEAVAGLGLDRRRPVAEHLVEPAPAVGGEGRLVGRPGRRDRREDPAAGGQDLEVARAALAEEELALAGAGEQQMRVRVDEARA